MTRKDYIKIADVFKYAYDEAEDIRERSILDIMLAEMMHTLNIMVKYLNLLLMKTISMVVMATSLNILMKR